MQAAFRCTPEQVASLSSLPALELPWGVNDSPLPVYRYYAIFADYVQILQSSVHTGIGAIRKFVLACVYLSHYPPI